MTDQMATKLTEFYQVETDSYNVRAIERKYGGDGLAAIFASFDDEAPQAAVSPEVQFAMDYNAAAAQRQNGLTADEVYDAVAIKRTNGERWIELRMQLSGDEEKRKLARMFIETMERAEAAQKALLPADYETMSGDAKLSAFSAVRDEYVALSGVIWICISSLQYILINGEPVARLEGEDEMARATSVNVKDVDSVGQEAGELFTRATEEYLVSIGL